MAYDLYPAVDSQYNFPPEVRAALAKSLDLRNTVVPMTEVLRNNLTGPELWDGRLILNTTTDRINRYDSAAGLWYAVADISDVNAATTARQAEINALSAAVTAKTGRRNFIRNGDMCVYQRGTGPFTASGVYTIDGWYKQHVGGGSHTVSLLESAPGAGAGINGGRCLLRSVTASHAAAGDYAFLEHRIEGVRSLAGKEVTLSFVALATAGTPKIGVEVQQYFGTGGSPSSAVNTAVQAIQISTAATRYTVTFTIPSIAGKTVGTNGDNYLSLILWLSSGANLAARASSIGIQNATIDISDVQLEEGKLSAFERLSVAEQVAWCQRFYQRLTATQNTSMGPLGFAQSSTVSIWTWWLRSSLRKVATGIGWSGANTFIPYTDVGGGYSQSIGFYSGDLEYIQFSLVSNGGLTLGRGCYIIPNVGAYLETVGAEL